MKVTANWMIVMRYSREIADELMASMIDKDIEREKGKVCLDFHGMMAVTPKFKEWAENGERDRRFETKNKEKVGVIVEWKNQ